jgi:multicomponent Na+:H+ antiporter subunit G
MGLFLFKGLTATGVKALLCMAFILLTAPVSAHALARSAYRSGVKPWEGTVIDEYHDDMGKIR